MIEIKGNKYKLVYLDTNAISEISKNYKKCKHTYQHILTRKLFS